MNTDVNSVTCSLAQELSRTPLKPGVIYVIGDGEIYGIVEICKNGSVRGKLSLDMSSDRKEFIEQHRKDSFYPVSDGARSDLIGYGFKSCETVSRCPWIGK